jgi:hypothetical protein
METYFGCGWPYVERCLKNHSQANKNKSSFTRHWARKYYRDSSLSPGLTL